MNSPSKSEITWHMDRMMESFEALFDQTCNQYLGKKLVERVQTAGMSEYLWARKDLEDALKNLKGTVKVEYDAKGRIKNSREIIRAFPSQEALERLLYERLSALYMYFPGTKVFIERLTDRLGDPDLAEGSVRLRILKQFLCYIRKSVYSIKKIRGIIEQQFSEKEREEFSKLKKEEEKRRFWAQHAKEIIFDSLTDPARFGLKPDDVRLLAISDNFARGRILNQGGTRRAIYEFGIVFGMNAYSQSDPRYDASLDIEKNLFFDYQINGYVDLLRERNEKAGADTANEELTTEGINYKNYAEILYLYTLNHPTLPREDRIKVAQDMIKACSPKTGVTAESDTASEDTSEETRIFRSYTYSELLTDPGYSLSPEELVQHIRGHYPVTEINRSISPLMQAAEQNSARRAYLHLCEQMDEELVLYDREWDELDYTLGIFEGTGTEEDPSEYPFPEELRMILLELNNELRHFANRRQDIVRGYREVRNRAGEIRQEKTILRRLDFLILYYEYFIAIHEDDNEEGILMLEDVYRSFADHLNPLFAKSRYVEISSKSMPDVLLILFAYVMVSLLS